MKHSIVVMCILSIIALSQPVTLWSRTYDLKNIDYYNDILASEDGGFILVGSARQDTCYHNIAKLIDYSGDPIDCYVFNSSSAGYAWDMCRSDQGGFVLAGWDSGTGGVLCSDFDGNVQWVTDMSTLGYYYIEAITRTLYSGYLAVGMLESSSSNDDFLAVKLDTSGNILWEYTCDISSGDIASALYKPPVGVMQLQGKLMLETIIAM